MHNFVVTAMDSTGNTVNHKVALTIMNVDEAPTLTDASLLMQSAAEGATLSLDVMTWFKDPDRSDKAFTVMVSDLPDFLTQDGHTGRLTISLGATDDAEVGTHTFTVTAADSSMPSLETVVNVELTLENTPEAPTVDSSKAPAKLTAMEGLMFSEDVSGWFTDPDLNIPGTPDVLTYTGMLANGRKSPGLAGTPFGDGSSNDSVRSDGRRRSRDLHAGGDSERPGGCDGRAQDDAHDHRHGARTDLVGELVGPACPGDEREPRSELTNFFTDRGEGNTPTPASALTFSVSDFDSGRGGREHHHGRARGSRLTLTPGTA